MRLFYTLFVIKNEISLIFVNQGNELEYVFIAGYKHIAWI